MKNKATVITAIALVAIVAGACSAAMGSSSQAKVAVGYDEFARAKNITREITINEGSELVVSLPSNPSTGYSWTDAAVGTPACLTQTGSSFVAPTGGAVGAAGTQVWTFKGAAKGTTVVKADYSRPWQGGEKGEWAFQLTVTVQ